MDCVCSYSKISHNTLPQFSSINLRNLQSTTLFKSNKKKNSLVLVASYSNNNNNNGGGENCAFNGLTAPLTPTTEAGRSLRGFLQHDKALFYAFVEKELDKLDYVKNDALLRSVFSLGTDEAILHRRISVLTKLECDNAVEDVMYMLIIYKFSQIGVHLVPKLSNCMYNGRLEILPRRDWELESIHSIEVLEMVKEIGWEDKSNMKDNLSLTQVQKHQIRHVYVASILYGYFFKSASLRYHLEQSFDKTPPSNLLFSRSWTLKPKSVPFGRIGDTESTSVGPVPLIEGKKKKHDNFRSYVMNFDHEIKIMCAKPKFKESKSLIGKHCSAFFGDEGDEEVSTSFASLKRLVLEAVAFGSFLWDAEDYVRKFYRLEEN
ncbi:UV-B-induced protein At3g17800, chloroplastic-like [Solanum dulcamara]|uniref:UV-B-induced protein At3g17800, chloroplastic-like n=1 Tax=Solanum dulcamara TaxID=45834 RepID=UPI0024865602|nr:UV-B-induced protein At3g17800, chloroplastic-like [Solanum dulcamara]